MLSLPPRVVRGKLGGGIFCSDSRLEGPLGFVLGAVYYYYYYYVLLSCYQSVRIGESSKRENHY